MTQEYTPVAGFTFTIPALTDNSDVVKAFSDFADDIVTYFLTFVTKTGASQTISSPLVLSGGTSITGSSFVVSSTSSINLTGSTGTSITIGASDNNVTVVPIITATAGVKGDIYASNGITKILENGTAGTASNSASLITNYDSTFYGTAATARSAVLYKATGSDYLTTDGYRRIFVGSTQPIGPTLQAGDIWMW